MRTTMVPLTSDCWVGYISARARSASSGAVSAPAAGCSGGGVVPPQATPKNNETRAPSRAALAEPMRSLPIPFSLTLSSGPVQQRVRGDLFVIRRRCRGESRVGCQRLVTHNVITGVNHGEGLVRSRPDVTMG